MVKRGGGAKVTKGNLRSAWAHRIGQAEDLAKLAHERVLPVPRDEGHLLSEAPRSDPREEALQRRSSLTIIPLLIFR